MLIRSGHACGRQRWRCKGCGRQFTRTTPRGKPAGMKRHAVELYCMGLSMNAVGQRLGVSAQSVLRWISDHARRHCPKPEPARAARPWSRSTRSGTSSKKVAQALDLEGVRARHRPADRLGVRRPRPGHAGSPAGPAETLGRAPVLHRRLGALRCGAAGGPALHRQGSDAGSESNNARQRHWFARFRRRTCVVSRSVEMVEATMALFAHYHCNGGGSRQRYSGEALFRYVPRQNQPSVWALTWAVDRRSS